MTTVIVGGTGFLGVPLTNELRGRGEAVVCLDIDPGESHMPGVDTAPVDITDRETLRDLLFEYEPESVVNLAYVLGAEGEADPSAAVRVNCVGMDNLFSAAVDAGVSRVVYASSIAAYGRPDSYTEPVKEDSDVPASFIEYPTLFYGATKQLNEYQARLYSEKSECEFAAVRPSVVFGPGRTGGITEWASSFVTNPARGKSTHIPFRSDQEFSMVYVQDVVDLFANVVLASDLPFHAYNTGGHRVHVSEIIQLVEREFGVEVTDDDDADSANMVADISHARAAEVFGYDLTPLEDAIKLHAKMVS